MLQSFSNYCRQLHHIRLQTGEPYRSEKIRLLEHVPEFKECNSGDIILFHHTLLTMLAWPENSALLDLTKKAMNKFISATLEKIRQEKRLENKLYGSGIAGTEITGHFSYDITKWLVKEFGRSVQLQSWDASPETAKLFFRQLLPRVEYETIFSGELSPLQRIKKLKGKTSQTDLPWLMNLFEQSEAGESIKDFIFNELKIFLSWKPEHSDLIDSCLQVPRPKIFYHNKPDRAVDFTTHVHRKLPSPARLTMKEKTQLANLAKATLVCLNRETDPFTFVSEKDMVCFDTGKGYSIALYSMKKENRLSIESYIGYLALKNGIPVAYGGGWIFGARCQFGINILEPFRGSQSSHIMSLLIRVYYQYYGVTRFVVKPYQFGKNNKEGITSGAFWFYYKSGFRPANEKLEKLAREEWEKKITHKNYRSTVQTLKKFTSSDLHFLLNKDAVPFYDAALVSKAITGFINRTYDGVRKKAVTDCFKKTKQLLGPSKFSPGNLLEKKVFKEWSLLAVATLDLSAWKTPEKKQFIQLLQSKANNNELDFIKRLQRHKRFWKDVNGNFT